MPLTYASARAQLSPAASGGPTPPPTTFAGPWFDEFPSAANVLFDTRNANGLAYVFDPGASGVACPIKTTGTGEAFGASTGASGFNFTYLPVGNTAENWTQRTLGLSMTSMQGANIGSYVQEVEFVGPGNVWNVISCIPGGFDQTTTLVMAAGLGIAASAARSTGSQQASSVYMAKGDTFETRKKTTGAVVTYDQYINGELVRIGTFDYAGLAMTRAGRVGYGGNLANAAGRTIQKTEVGDPAQHAMIRIIRSARTMVPNPTTGDLSLSLEGYYTLAAPSSLLFYLRNSATGVDATGYSGVALSGLTLDTVNKKWTATINVSAAAITVTNTYRIGIQRTDIIGSAPIDWSCVQRIGPVIMDTGQSISTEADYKTVTPAATAAAVGWSTDGSLSNLAPSTVEGRRTARGSTTIATSGMLDVLATKSGINEMRLGVVKCGMNGTYVQERTIGTTYWTAGLDGLRRVGNRVTHAVWSLMEYEASAANPTLPSTLAFADLINIILPVLDAECDAIDALCGYAVPVMFTMLGHIHVDSAQAHSNTQFCRKFIDYLCTVYNPTRYRLGSPRADLQPGSFADIFHYSDAGRTQQRKRDGWSLSYWMGYSSEHRNGPKLVSGSRVNDHQLILQIDPQTATNINIINQVSSGGDWRGAFTFAANDATFANANQRAPINATVGAISGGLYPITLDFTAGDFPGAAMVRTYWGSCPFTRAGPASTTWLDPTITVNPQTLASMWVGTYANGDTVPVQPFFNHAGNDYLTLV